MAELIQVCEALPPEKQAELADFARFLLARQDDEAWEQRLAAPQARPRLDSFLRDSATEGDKPLDPNRLRIRARDRAFGARTRG